MDPYSPEYMSMNNRITKASNILFPYPSQQSYRELWEDNCLKKWLDNPLETPDVQASRRSPAYKKTYAKRPPNLGY